MTNDERAGADTNNAKVRPVAEPLVLDAGDVREYRFRKQYFWIGSLCTVFFLAAGVASFVAAWWNLDGSFRHPRETAIGFAAFWSFWFALGVGMLLTYYRERLVISTDRVDWTRVFRTRSMHCDEVLSARWRTVYGRGGSLVLRSTNGKIVVHFDRFTNGDQEELRAIFRSILDEKVQENWAVDRQKARRIRLIVAAVFIIHACAFCALAVAGIGNRVELLIFAVLNLVVSVWLVAKVRATKSTEGHKPIMHAAG